MSNDQSIQSLKDELGHLRKRKEVHLGTIRALEKRQVHYGQVLPPYVDQAIREAQLGIRQLENKIEELEDQAGSPPRVVTQRLGLLCKALGDNRFNNPNQKPTVLILGSRLSIDGGLNVFGHIVENVTGDSQDFDGFYRKIEDIDDPDERFRQFHCHLVDHIPLGYQNLAELVKWNYFPLILTTNCDDTLERAIIEAGLHPGDFAVFSIGKAGLSKSYVNMVRCSLPKLDPPIKIIKLNGDLATRNIATLKDLKAIQEAYKDVLRPYLIGPVLIVASGPADGSFLWGLRGFKENTVEDYKPVWIVDSKYNLLDHDTQLQSSFNARNERRELAANRLIIDPHYGDPEEFFRYLARELIQDPKPVRGFNAHREVGTPRKSCATVWKDIGKVDFLKKAKEAGACFPWNGLTIPFWAVDQHEQWPQTGYRWPDAFEFIERPGDFSLLLVVGKFLRRLAGFEFIDRPGDFSLDRAFRSYYRILLERDRARRGGKGCEWNDSRIRLTEARRLPGGRWRFHWQKLDYFKFRATNLYLQDRIREELGIKPKQDRGRAPDILQYVRSYKDFRDFSTCFLGGAVGTGIIVVGKDGKGLVAQRDPGLAQDADIYQLSGTGGVDPIEDRIFGKIDIFHSAWRETYYESGIKVPKENFICVNWGIDLMIGHPIFNFIALTDQDITTAAASYRPESFETTKFRWVDLHDRGHVKEFLENVEVSSNNAVLIIKAHDWVKEHLT